jgi:DNA (cytosine-5)-methyltransferase 1
MVIKYMESMSEVRAVPWNGLNVVSTFSGAGGSCLGYRMAGYRVLWANEFVEHARATYKANHASSIVDATDIRKLSGADIRKAVGDVPIHVLDGSPPCVAFSTASGTRNNNWGEQRAYSGTEQRVDDLFFEYARILNDLKPPVFIAENVTGLMKGKAKGYFNAIHKALTECGYNVSCMDLHASSYGVPQKRERIFFVGYRRDADLQNEWPMAPRPHKYMTRVCDSPHLDQIRRFRISGAPNKWSTNRSPFSTIVARIATLSKTAYMSANGYIETPELKQRKLTIKECKVICGYPLDFKLHGDKKLQYERLGRSVPPTFMANLSEKVAQHAFGR